jgi:hypothetical protein
MFLTANSIVLNGHYNRIFVSDLKRSQCWLDEPVLPQRSPASPRGLAFFEGSLIERPGTVASFHCGPVEHSSAVSSSLGARPIFSKIVAGVHRIWVEHSGTVACFTAVPSDPAPQHRSPPGFASCFGRRQPEHRISASSAISLAAPWDQSRLGRHG